MTQKRFTRRRLLQGAAHLGAFASLHRFLPAYAMPEMGGMAPQNEFDLRIARTPFAIGTRAGSAVTANGQLPGPVLRWREGDTVTVRVHNQLEEVTSVHWHGILLPPDMDGVPGVSFGGIQPGETFTYRFPVRQSGTYWAHSHSGGQELLGLYFPLIIDPRGQEPFQYDADHAIVLSDWSFETPEKILQNLKRQGGYYNFQRRTVPDLVRDLRDQGWSSTIAERLAWARMRMDPTDFADVSGYTYTYLMNGLAPDANWTGLFRRGEQVRLRFINAGAMTYFDVRLPGLKMTVVQTDGQNVQPVTVDEFRIAPGETLDVLVRPEADVYTIFAETMDRSGYARGTLAVREGMGAEVPERRRRPLRSMADMGMGADMPGMDMSAGDMPGMATGKPAASVGSPHDMGTHGSAPTGGMVQPMAGMESRDMAPLKGPSLPGSMPVEHGPDTHGPGNSSVAMQSRSRLDDPGSGLEAGGRVLVYADLKSVHAQADTREPAREIELHITGNMDRYMFSFDGKKYSEARTPIAFHYGERLRLILVNDTMMEHPIHLHGMWMELENGAGRYQPRKHTISVKPAERLSVAITADALGQWAMHCHLLLHMEMGMFRVVEVAPRGGGM